jgi:hypothetical protein
VRDQNGQQLAYVYFEEEPGRRSAAKLLSKDEARRLARIERNENMETFCGWIDCYASYAGNYMPPGWASLLAVGTDQPLPSSVTLCPEHARALQAQLKSPAAEN